MRRTLPPFPKVLVAAILLVSAGCSQDAVTTPMPNVSLMTAPPEPGSISASVPSHVLQYMDTVKVTFTVTPTVGGAAQIGNHMINIPKYTVCDMSVTAYGPSEWMNSCSVTSASVTISATSWVDDAGRPHIDFSPALRFRVNNNGELPTLYLRDADATLQSWSSINYCATMTSLCVNEAAVDAVLQTRRDPVTGFLYRFIRHFSGYNVWA